ncbi:MAG: FitA-like ribbon-helix-helix domain-containing protein [Microcystaceae cyanobacterium]
MANLIVRNIDSAILSVLKQRAGLHGISAEAEHRCILEQVLLQPSKRSLAEVLTLIPDVGLDADFERVQDNSASGKDFVNAGVDLLNLFEEVGV